jgi:hypothetical protein
MELGSEPVLVIHAVMKPCVLQPELVNYTHIESAHMKSLKSILRIKLQSFNKYEQIYRSWDSSVSIVTWLLGGRPRSRGSISGKCKKFSLLHNVQIGCGATPAHIQWPLGCSYPEGEAAGV